MFKQLTCGVVLLMNNYIAPYMNNYPNRCYLIQDNNSKHTSHLCQNTSTENNIQWVNLFYNFIYV